MNHDEDIAPTTQTSGGLVTVPVPSPSPFRAPAMPQPLQSAQPMRIMMARRTNDKNVVLSRNLPTKARG